MNTCKASPAEQYALAYVEGTLSEAETEQFEEHFFECPVCLEYLQTIQAAGIALAKQPVAEVAATPQRGRLLAFPARAWALGAVAAALLLVGIFIWRGAMPGGRQQPQLSQTTPAPAAQPATPAPAPKTATVKPSQLADLTLPAFIAPNLRGANEDTHFEAGMKAYSSGDCRVALATLSNVPAAAGEARAAQFYRAACQMHLGDYAAAAKGMRAVAAAGDSPQQESALYYEAQLALQAGEASAAHRYLRQTIALRGDLEKQARAQDGKVQDLIAASQSGNEPAKTQ